MIGFLLAYRQKDAFPPFAERLTGGVSDFRRPLLVGCKGKPQGSQSRKPGFSYAWRTRRGQIEKHSCQLLLFGRQKGRFPCGFPLRPLKTRGSLTPALIALKATGFVSIFEEGRLTLPWLRKAQRPRGGKIDQAPEKRHFLQANNTFADCFNRFLHVPAAWGR